MKKTLLTVSTATIVGASAMLAPVAAANAAESADTSAAIQSKKVKTFKNGFPIPAKKVDRWNLRKTELKQIAKSKRWASTPKAKSVIRCESGGKYHISGGSYSGAWQFLDSTWRGAGGGRYSSSAHQAPKFAQDHIAWKLYQRSGWGPWSCA